MMEAVGVDQRDENEMAKINKKNTGRRSRSKRRLEG
jgi:hypothetical protein